MNIQRNVNQLLAIGAGLKAMKQTKVDPTLDKLSQKEKIQKKKQSIAESKLKTLQARTDYKELKKDPYYYNKKDDASIKVKYQQEKDKEIRTQLGKVGITEGSYAFESAMRQLKGEPYEKIKGDKK